jgi:hypothetical protein
MIFLEDLLDSVRPQSIGLKANRIQKLREPFANPVRGHGLSLLESQELNLLDQDRFVRFLLSDSDPVSTALSI